MPSMVAYAFNPSARTAMSLGLPWTTQSILGLPWLNSKTLSETKQTNKTTGGAEKEEEGRLFYYSMLTPRVAF